MKSLGSASTTSISSFLFRRTKSTVSSFLPDIKLGWRNLTTVSMVEWQVTRQSSVLVTPLLYLVFLLMYLDKIVSKTFWTPCDVDLEKQTSVFGLELGLQ